MTDTNQKQLGNTLWRFIPLRGAMNVRGVGINY